MISMVEIPVVVLSVDVVDSGGTIKDDYYTTASHSQMIGVLLTR